MVLANLVEGNAVLVVDAVLAHLPECNGSDGVGPYIQFSRIHNAIGHLDHGLFLLVADLALAADADDDVGRLHDGDKVDFELEDVGHLLDEFLPVLERQPHHLGDVELLEVVLLLEAGRVDRVGRHVLYGQDVLVLLPPLTPPLLRQLLIHPLTLPPLLVHYAQNGEEARSSHVDHILVEFEDEAAVGDDLAPFLEGLVEVGLLLQLDASVVEGVGVEGGEAVVPAVLPLVVHDVVVVADRVQFHEGTLPDATHPRPVLRTHGMRLAARTLHQLITIETSTHRK